MKKIFKLLTVFTIILLFSGCTNDSMDNINIYTSVYPIEYISNKLYKNHAKINNMYPRGINPYEYKFTSKQIEDYEKSNLIIYDGSSNEKNYIAKMLNDNKKLKIIDATNNIENKKDEIWLNPSSMLMMSQNIREGLKEYVDSTLIKDEIDKNYENLKISISSLDADLKEMAENAENKNIIVQNNALNFLTKYGLNIYSIDDKAVTDKTFSDCEKIILNGDIKYIYLLKDEKENIYTKRLLKEFPNLTINYIDPINNISTSDLNEGQNYISIMNDNIDKFKQELY